MIRQTTQLGDAALKAKNLEVTDFNSEKVKQVIADLVETMRATGLVGMAAPQIGENFMIFVTEPRVTPMRTIDQADELRIYINPKIVESSEEKVIIYEGSVSVANAGIFGPMLRSKEITIEAFNENGNKFQLTCDGLLARIIQHEMGHLEGKTFIEDVDDYSKLLSPEAYVRDIKTSELQVNNANITKKEVKKL
jgi:peptide deformylase